MTYTEEEISLVLRSVARVMDLNDIPPSTTVKDILPDYPNKKIAEWSIGFFLFYSRHGHNVKFYDILHELGFSFYKKGLISQMNIVCDAIDELVEAGVDLDKISIKARMSDYLEKYKGESNNFTIGVTLENARNGRECKAVMSKLEEYNFNFNSMSVTREGIIKQIVIDVAKVTDLRTIPAKAVIGDYLPDYEPRLRNYRIGTLVQNIRAGYYKFLTPTLKELNFSFENVKHRTNTSIICGIIDDLIVNDVDLNDINRGKVVGDYIPNHPHRDYEIGRVISHASSGYVGKEIKKKLEENNFLFIAKNITHEQKVEFITNVAVNHNLNRIKEDVLLGDVLPDCDPRYAWWEIGRFLETNRKTRDPRYIEVLEKYGFKYHKVEKKHAPDFAIKAIRDLVDEGVDLNAIKQRARMSDFLENYSEEDLVIGALLSNARANKVSEGVIAELMRHNFDFTKKTVTVTLETKLETIKRVISTGVNINDILPSHRLSNFIQLAEGENNYRVGRWIADAEKLNQSDLLNEIVNLGYECKETIKK